MKTIVTIILCLALFAPLCASAAGIRDAGGMLGSVGNQTVKTTSIPRDFGATVKIIVNAVLALVGTIFLIMMVYAGILWMTAAGNADRADKGKRILAESVIGVVITLGAFAIVSFVGGKLGSSGGPTGGGQSCPGTCRNAYSCETGEQMVTGDCAQKSQICCMSLLK